MYTSSMLTERLPMDRLPTNRVTNLRNRIVSRAPSQRTLIRGSLPVVTVTIVAVLAAVFTDDISVDTAGVVISGILAVATFSYVLLTYSMASSMDENLEQTKELFKLRRKPDIIRIIKNEIDPLLAELWSHRNTFNADGFNEYDSWGSMNGTLYNRHPELESDFERPDIAASLSQEVDVNNGDIHVYYRSLEQYQETYNRAVSELSMELLRGVDSLGIDSDDVKAYAESALAIEPIGVHPDRWRAKKDDVIPFRSEIRELDRELEELKQELKRDGHALRQDLGQAKIDLQDEYYITRADMQVSEQSENEDE